MADKLSKQELTEKWGKLLEHEKLPKIEDANKIYTTAQVMENTHNEVSQGKIQNMTGMLSEAPHTTSVSNGGIQNYDPVLISLVRRAMPNLIAHDIAGVQPMTGPTGLIFAMRSRYDNMQGDEAFYQEADTDFSGDGTHAGNIGTANTANTGVGMSTADAEALGDSANNAFPEMSFSIESISVTAKSRALKAEYTTEVAQDLQAIHGLDAESELATILTSEILAEINREMVRTIYNTAKVGSQNGVNTAGQYDLDVDSNGRWMAEKFKGMMFQIETEANQIARHTRRGKGNIVLCSSDVASALQMAGMLDYAPAMRQNLSVDDTGNTFAGVLNGRYKVYIDPYAQGNFFIVGYKGQNSWDAGLFYCPYVPLQMVRATGENSFQPKIAFKTRYGLVANPYAEGANQGNGRLQANTNVYYRRTLVQNLY